MMIGLSKIAGQVAIGVEITRVECIVDLSICMFTNIYDINVTGSDRKLRISLYIYLSFLGTTSM